MNNISIKHIGVALAISSALAACGSGKAPDAAANAPAPADQAEVAAAKPAEPLAAIPAAAGEEATTAIPDTADAIWKAIDQQSTDLKATIQSGALKDVHHKAFAIRDLVAALPTHSPTLSADDGRKLQGEVKFVVTLADRLDAAGDANDKAGAQENYDKLVAVLGGINRNK